MKEKLGQKLKEEIKVDNTPPPIQLKHKDESVEEEDEEVLDSPPLDEQKEEVLGDMPPVIEEPILAEAPPVLTEKEKEIEEKMEELLEELKEELKEIEEKETKEAPSPLKMKEDTSLDDDIDVSIKMALERLVSEQAEAYEDDDNGGYLSEKELLALEDTPPPAAPPATPKPPIIPDKASFLAWLKLMKSPTPKGEGRDPKPKKKNKKKSNESKLSKEHQKLLKILEVKKSLQLREPPEETQHRKVKVVQLAEESLQENEEVVSETLAKILVIQGKLDKALNMYQRLSLKFPEKSSYFAAEIEKIQNQL
jgi:hypothetical protein